MALHVELVSPERIVYSGEANMVICRTTDGEIAFLTGHAPFVGALGTGTVTIRVGSGVSTNDVEATIDGGFVEVRDDRRHDPLRRHVRRRGLTSLSWSAIHSS